MAPMLALMLALIAAAGVRAQGSPAAASAAERIGSAAPIAPAPAPVLWLSIRAPRERMRAADIGLVINRADPYSVAVGRAYQARRGLSNDQVLEVDLPLQVRITPAQLDALRLAIDARFGDRVQALALAWVNPSAVACNSLVGALALGFDEELCRNSCARSRPSPWFNSPSARPHTDHHFRPAMHLAAPDEAQALALIERGVAADGQLGLRGGLPATAALLDSEDRARNVRRAVYPTVPLPRASGVVMRTGTQADLAHFERLLLVQGSTAQVQPLKGLQWLPGALADHLTSFGGRLDGGHSQTTVLDWIGSGATASYGTVSEPCNLLQKFPHPQLLLLNYMAGATAIEAYWKSVAWPQQGIFVGEPLAAPFARRR